MVTCTLEECRYIKSHVVEAEGETILESCVRITEDLAVTWVFYAVLTDADLTVTVNINILEVTGKPSACKSLCDVAEVNLLCISLSLCICSEKTVSNESSDLSEFHTYIVILCKDLILVVILCDDGLVVREVSADAVSEWLSTEFELVSPADRELIT